MRIYVKKNKHGFIIYKETAIQSLINDGFSLLTLGAIVAINRSLSAYYNIQSSFWFDMLFVIIAITFMSSAATKFKPENTDEIKKIIDDLNEVK